jgi:rSAM/selenodomain-associated transferase 1
LKDKNSLAIVAKYPEERKVKTRLIPYLGPKKSKDLYEAMLLDTLSLAGGCGFFDETNLFYRAANSNIYFDKFKNKGIKIHRQKGHDLGEVFLDIFKRLSGSSGKIVIIGSDSPTLPVEYLRISIKILLSYSVVLGPALDGGFYLIGVNTKDFLEKEPDYSRIFEDVNWSTEKTLRDLINNLEKRKLSFGLVPEWYDIDSPSDLELLRESLSKSSDDEYIALKNLDF